MIHDTCKCVDDVCENKSQPEVEGDDEPFDEYEGVDEFGGIFYTEDDYDWNERGNDYSMTYIV